MRDRRYSLMGPAILITVGTLFLIHEMRPAFGIGRLWPIILIVIGVIRLLEARSGVGCATDTAVTSGNPPPASGPAPSGGAGASGGAGTPGGAAGTGHS